MTVPSTQTVLPRGLLALESMHSSWKSANNVNIGKYVRGSGKLCPTPVPVHYRTTPCPCLLPATELKCHIGPTWR